MVSNFVTSTVTAERTREMEENKQTQGEREAEIIGRDKWKEKRKLGIWQEE
jgi:hypothetical protein